jgi:hypothetical protein
MKKQLTTLLLVSAMFSVHAQDNDQRPGHKQQQQPRADQRRAERREMMQSLNLSEDQKTKMKSIREEQATKMQALEKEQNITVKQYNDRKTALQNEMKSKREAVLTAEQKSKLAERKAKQAAQKNEQFANRMNKMSSSLGLSDEQKKKMESLRESNQAKVKSIKEDASLNNQQKKIKLMELKKEAQTNRKKILTPDQLQKMEEIKKKKQAKNPSGQSKD